MAVFTVPTDSEWESTAKSSDWSTFKSVFQASVEFFCMLPRKEGAFIESDALSPGEHICLALVLSLGK